MIVGWIGRALKLVARLRSPEDRTDLEHVADELVRLDRRRPPQPRTTSR